MVPFNAVGIGQQMDWLSNFLFSDGGYSPHGFCIAWDPAVLYTHIGADLLIAISYFAIPAVMLVFLRHRKDSRLHAPAMLFVVFIAACGLSHLMSIVTMFYPWYGLQGLMKLFTGLVSALTAVALWRMLPNALRIPAPEDLMQAIEAKDAEIADRQAAQQELETAQQILAGKIDELEAANQELREFAYAASHDLKSPANTISLWLDDFAEVHADKLDADSRDELDEVQRVVERMRLLVEDILSFSRIVSHDGTDPERCDLVQLSEDACHDLRAEIEKAQAQVHIGQLDPIFGHPRMISILIHNLIGNALKFRATDRSCRIEITTIDRGDALLLRVKDNGIGIAEEHRDRIFQLFKRLHRETEYEGTGLGLALCRRIAAMHAGSIAVRSEPGFGSTFEVTFPKEFQDAQEAA